MLRCSSRGKDPAIDLTSSSVSKRTWHSSEVPNCERFKTPLDSQTFSSIFQDAPLMVERIVQFDTLGSTFIPRIFADRDWTELFGNFEDLVDKLVKEFYSNARYTGVELQCWGRGKEFTINPDYFAKLLRITRPANADRSPYDDRQLAMSDILRILGEEHEVSTKGTSIRTVKFKPKLKTLTFIMFFNLYPLSNTRFINLGRAQFLCNLINGTPIDICTHIFQTIGKIAARSATKLCLPFCSLVMKIMLNEGVCLPSDGKIVVRRRPISISISSLEKSKSHFSAGKKKKNLSTPLMSLSGHESVAHTTETTSYHVLAPQTVGTQPGQSNSQTDWFTTLVEGLHGHMSGLTNLIHSTNNQVQMRLTAIKTQLDEIQRKLKESL